MAKKAIIIGAGPAGLTAAMELLEKTDIIPVVYEASDQIGGIAKTVNYKGNRIDIGGHRFFSKSDWVMDWWTNIMPLQGSPAKDELLLNVSYHNQSRSIKLNPDGPDPEKTDLVMLVRQRLSRIFYLRKFFAYPVSLNAQTIKNLGFWRMAKIGVSYAKVRLFPIKDEKTLEDFFINRFGRELYLTFFKDYSEKVWGAPCNEIAADFGYQRVKGLSVSKAISHALKQIVKPKKASGDISQKDTETSLIEQFMYPKLGPGQMWEEVARQVQEKGGQVIMRHQAVGLETEGERVTAAMIKNQDTGATERVTGDYFFSTMPVRELMQGLKAEIPTEVKRVAEGLQYRDFITVGLLVDKLKIQNETDRKTVGNIVPDNWIYIQERDVKVGRLQIFNNWSPYMVKDPVNTVWVGMEYFVNEGDELWRMSDEEFAQFAIHELDKIDIIEKENVKDHTVLRVLKAYPGYFGTYDEFETVRAYLDSFDNLFLIGRNGMHRYNNQDHSMLTAMTAVQNIAEGRTNKDNIWAVNAEQEYHETKDEARKAPKAKTTAR